MSRSTTGAFFASIAMLGAAQAATAEDILIGLITKTEANPFFAKMREGAELKAAELGVTVQSFAGKNSEDNESQVAAIESLIAAGAKGILLVANDTNAITVAVQKARDAGILVVALDTPLDPVSAADVTFATDNFHAGELIGRWAAGHLGANAADARIAFLDAVESQISVDYMRDQGFMAGFGIDIMEANHYGEETDPRIVGHQWTGGSEEGGRTGMENLLQKDPSINLVYSVNEPSAAGAYEALKAVGREHEVTIVSIDGGCPGVENVKAGVIGATAQQYPLQMAAFGIEAVVHYVQTGDKPLPGAGYDFIDTGVELVTDQPVPGLNSIDSAAGLEVCWG